MKDHTKREPTIDVVSFRATADLLRQITELAELEERSVADTVRRLVIKALAAPKKARK
jgi:hypothetical protein